MKTKLIAFLKSLRILPVLIIVASFGFVVRLGDTYFGIKSMSGSALAEDAKPTEEPKPDEKVEIKEEEPSQIDLPATDTKDEKVTDEKAPPEKWQDASDTDMADSDIKKSVFEDLSKRRQDIEDKEKKLGEREALLEAAQKELDKKVDEMEGLRDELRDLLKQQTAAEASRIESLVKIYSGMKPKDAARIFNTLDTDILMDVISHMPEQKAGGIIAMMDADRAKALTTLLAEQKKLPDMP